MSKEYLKWSDIRIGTWSVPTRAFVWEDVSLIDELVGSSGGDIVLATAQANKLPRKKKLQLIKIILTLQNKEYVESKYKTDKDIKIHIDDIKFLFDNKTKVKVTVDVINDDE